MKFTANYITDCNDNALPQYVVDRPALKRLVCAQCAAVQTCESYERELDMLLDYNPLAAEAVNLFIQLTGPERHSQRVLATFIEASNLAGTEDLRARLAKVYLICLLDHHGLKVHNKVGLEAQEKTTRILYRLGKGRWHASDGPIWRAAIQEVLWSLNGFAVRPVEDGLYIVDPEEKITKASINWLSSHGLLPWVESYIETEMCRLWDCRYTYDQGTWANWALNFGLLYKALKEPPPPTDIEGVVQLK